MSKKTIAIFFSVIFISLISAPTIIMAIDDSIDISILTSVTEEEENENIKLHSPEDLDPSEPNTIFSNIAESSYFVKAYTKPHLNLVSPPPETKA